MIFELSSVINTQNEMPWVQGSTFGWMPALLGDAWCVASGVGGGKVGKQTGLELSD